MCECTAEEEKRIESRLSRWKRPEIVFVKLRRKCHGCKLPMEKGTAHIRVQASENQYANICTVCMNNLTAELNKIEIERNKR
jgi:hypothetical protein